MGRSRDIVMAGLFSTALHNEPMLAIGIPVEIRGEVRYGLYAQIRPQRIGQALRRQAMPDGWVAAALDDDGLIVGRTREECATSASTRCHRWPPPPRANAKARCAAKPRKASRC